MLFSDLELARRLEMTDALAGVEFARSWARLNSFDGQAFLAVGGGYAGFGGVDSPLTQAFAVGLQGPVTEDDFSSMEEFYKSHGAPVNIETCPLADPSLLQLLNERHYRPIEYSNVFVRELTQSEAQIWPDPSSRVQIRKPRADEAEAYSLTVIKCFFESVEIPDSFLSVFVSCFFAEATHFFLAEIDGAAAGGGMMSIHNGVASLGGAGTLPEFRNRGIQKALLQARVAKAAELACDLAMVATAPGSGSQRNVERAGFRVAYTRTKFLRVI
jgi:ribosomal protein S18 acetylase RimI-like enzyme